MKLDKDVLGIAERLQMEINAKRADGKERVRPRVNLGVSFFDPKSGWFDPKGKPYGCVCTHWFEDFE